MNVPDDLKYTTDHEWIRISDTSKNKKSGITDYAQSELGDIVFFEIETQDETLEKEDAYGTIEAVKTVSDLLMPVSGKVATVNPELEDNPEIVNADPYGEGWLIEIEMTNPEEADNLLTPEQYRELISE